MAGSLGIRIRMARRRKEMTQGQLASVLHVSRSAVGNWEAVSGISPSSTRLIAIALATDVSYEWLATGRGEPSLCEDWTPAADAELVDDPLERRVLRAFRHARPATRKMVLQMLEAGATSRT